MNQSLKRIQSNQEVRASLISLIAELKEDTACLSAEERALLVHLLPEIFLLEDPKIRKHAARLCGLLAEPALAKTLMEAYLAEETRFVKTAYLEAMLSYPVEPYRETLLQQEKALRTVALTPENQKHVNEELVALSKLLSAAGSKKHTVTNANVVCDVCLTGDRAAIEKMEQALPVTKKKAIGGGLLVRTEQARGLFSCRLFKELLFLVPGCITVSADPYEAAEQLMKKGFYRFCCAMHEAEAGENFSYRINVRGAAEDKKKALLIKRLGGELLRLSGGALKNDPSDYEIDLRLIPRKEGDYRVLVRLMRLADRRFSYREGVVAASIHPVDAAVCMEYAKPYLKEGAQILDPFCGVGTMLAERNFCVKAGTTYGIDTFGDAIEKARRNLARAGLSTNLIHRDFFDFTHKYLFDEVVTNLPFATGKEDVEQVERLIGRFFQKISSHLKPEGVVMLHTRNKEACVREAKRAGFTRREAVLIQEKTDSWFLVFQQN